MLGARAPAVLGTSLRAPRFRQPQRMCSQRGARRRQHTYAAAHWVADEKTGSLVDYYELLGVKQDATKEEIKSAYYDLCKVCHPDVAGAVGGNLCVLLNSAYATLRDDEVRLMYDEELEASMEDLQDGFTGKCRSKWCGPETEQRAVFVDENTCIGCKQCVWAAPAVFRMELLYGRSQVFGQWLNGEEELQTAIDACPVDREQLPVLEHVMAKLPRVNVGVMMSGQGGAVQDVFQATAQYVKKRDEAASRRAAEKQRRRSGAGAGDRRRRTDEVGLDAVREAFYAATGWRWNPTKMRERGSTIPISRSLVVQRGRAPTALDELRELQDIEDYREQERLVEAAAAAKEKAALGRSSRG